MYNQSRRGQSEHLRAALDSSDLNDVSEPKTTAKGKPPKAKGVRKVDAPEDDDKAQCERKYIGEGENGNCIEGELHTRMTCLKEGKSCKAAKWLSTFVDAVKEGGESTLGLDTFKAFHQTYQMIDAPPSEPARAGLRRWDVHVRIRSQRVLRICYPLRTPASSSERRSITL